MIVADRKPFEEILRLVDEAEHVLVMGCGTCVAVCLAGGDQEAQVLTAQLEMAAHMAGRTLEVETATVQRQCEVEFLDAVAEQVAGCDLVVSLGCGAGTQLCAERFEPVRVVPAVDTRFVGANVEAGIWEETCQACGDCVLHLTGGICPIARCSKSLLNGPCGGSCDGHCEIDDKVPCGWQLIHDRLRAIGRLALLDEVIPPKNWRQSRHGGPRRREVERARDSQELLQEGEPVRH